MEVFFIDTQGYRVQSVGYPNILVNMGKNLFAMWIWREEKETFIFTNHFLASEFVKYNM